MRDAYVLVRWSNTARTWIRWAESHSAEQIWWMYDQLSAKYPQDRWNVQAIWSN